MSLDKSTIKRIANDVKYLINNPLDNENIYYKHCEDNILKGYALLIINNKSPYQYGNYLFEFNFPNNYPFSPPTLKYLTNDGNMRFNPNLYIDGKVCLSLLNTWNGEGWTSSQTIYSILITLTTLFNNKPLLNEPGIHFNNENIEKYNLLVSYKNIEISIIDQIMCIVENNVNKNYLYLFKNEILKNFTKNNKNILENIKKLKLDLNNYKNIININVYNLFYNLDTNILENKLKKIKIEN